MQIIDNENVYQTEKVLKGTVLAFDFGERRIGVAVGEHLIKSANPLITIDSESNEVRFMRITALIQEWQPVLLVVGLPLSLDGAETEMTQLCKKFARRLNGRFNLPVALIDERYSSAHASQLLNQTGIKGRAQKTMLDQVAAQTILQSYFDGLS
ncbi:MAG: Holliday junction resolvase RuvX [Methylotenera sp.]